MTAEVPAHEEHPELQDLAKIQEFMAEHGRKLSIGFLVVLVIVVLVNGLRIRHQNTIRSASAKLGSASSIQELEAIVADFGSTEAAPLALIRLAKAHYDGGNYDAADAKYDEFITQYPTHEFAVGARLGKVHCAEAKGKIVDALNQFKAFAGENPGHYLLPQAVLGQARCLEHLGRLEEARTILEDFIVGNPESGWIPQIEERLDAIVKELGPADVNEETVTVADEPADDDETAAPTEAMPVQE